MPLPFMEYISDGISLICNFNVTPSPTVASFDGVVEEEGSLFDSCAVIDKHMVEMDDSEEG